MDGVESVGSVALPVSVALLDEESDPPDVPVVPDGAGVSGVLPPDVFGEIGWGVVCGPVLPVATTGGGTLAISCPRMS